ncbi:MAG: NAD(P)H-hydrate dehydratase [Clostridiales bacterium]|nr:NAD(P)H-hydrate dehydratase [Clostridiales bacterium]
MRVTVTGRQMKAIDGDTIHRIGIPSLVLMERAALALADEAAELAGTGGRILIACGTGNNGADGIAAGRILYERGYDVTVLLAGNLERASEEHLQQQRIARALGVCMLTCDTFIGGAQDRGQEGFGASRAGGYDVIVDAIFGIGLTREIEGAYRELIAMLRELAGRGADEDGGRSGLSSTASPTGIGNAGLRSDGRRTRVVAADMPSGISSETGAVMGIALPADVTVTFGFLKTGLLLYPGRLYAGEVKIADVGFSDESLSYAGYDCLTPGEEDLSRLPTRRADGNKGTFGRVLVIAGSHGMSGACYLSALAAYRTGAGLVKILTVPENRTILQTQLPEAILSVYDPGALLQDEEEKAFVEEQCDWADVIILGPGLGQEPYVEYLTELVLSHAYVPIVLDADGLNTVAANPYLTRYFTENIVITPHMGEMARLTSQSVPELKSDPVRAAREYSSRYGVVCVMKDAATVTADKDGAAYVNTSGCSAMAKGGSGDVLTGVIAGLIARGMDLPEAAACGVYVHGLAGEAAAKRCGSGGVLAHDIADAIRV